MSAELALELQLKGMQLVEASAGTGKTHFMCGVFLRGLIELRLTVDRILTMTFTNAATSELRSRLRTRIDAACRALDVDARPSDDPLLRALIERALQQETREALQQRLVAALRDLDQAAVTTIHAFCSAMLRDLPPSDDNPERPNAQLVADSGLIDDVLRDVWRAVATSSESERAALQPVLDQLGDYYAFHQHYAPLLGDLEVQPAPTPDATGRYGAFGQAAVQLCDQARALLAARKLTRGVYTFEDQLARLHRALQGEQGRGLAQSLAARFPLLLIDEFQDTDPRQYAIARSILDAGSRALILVGDPKQAIYGFRGGDLNTYLRARADVAAPHSLSRNFRSSAEFLHALNLLYAQAGERAFSSNAQQRIRYETMSAAGDVHEADVVWAAGTERYAPLTLFTLGGEIEFRSKENAEIEIARHCAQLCVDLLSAGARGDITLPGDVRLAGKHIAILVANHNQSAKVRQALIERGIASASERRESVYSSGEAADLTLVLDALISRRDGLLRGALTTALYRCGPDELDALRDPNGAAWAAQLAELDADRSWLYAHGVLALLQRLLARIAQTMLATPSGERQVTNFLQLGELLSLGAGVRDPETARSTLWRGRAKAEKSDEAQQLQLESDAERVRVMTIHTAKGLQFEMVILPFVGARGQARRDPPWRLHNSAGRRQLWLCADAPDAVREQALGAEDDEQQRLLYVALTRAKYRCFVGASILGSKGPDPALLRLGSASRKPYELLSTLRALEREAPESIVIRDWPALGNERFGEPERALPALPRQFTQPLRSDAGVLSFTRLLAADERRGAGPGLDESADASAPSSTADFPEISMIPRGARYGIVVHSALESADFAVWSKGDPDALALEQRQITAIVERADLRADGLSNSAVTAVVQDCVARTLNAPLPPGLRLCELPPDARRAELPFTFALHDCDLAAWLPLLHAHDVQPQRSSFSGYEGALNALLTGVIDLVYQHDGRYYLIDYKTNALGPWRADYQPAALDRAMREHDYDLQALIYCVALHLWLQQRLPDYDYDQHVGGHQYLFVRALDPSDPALGVHQGRFARELVEGSAALLQGMRA